MTISSGKHSRILAALITVGVSLCITLAFGGERQVMPIAPLPPDVAPLPPEVIQSGAPTRLPSTASPAPQPVPLEQQRPLAQPIPPIPSQNLPTVPYSAVPEVAPAPVLPPGFLPWWQAEVTHPFQPQTALVPVAPTGLVLAALAHSAQIRALNESVFIGHSAIPEAEGKFDPRAFVESRLIADSDPVGNTLTTGGPDPWIDTHWYGSAGIRKQGLSGAQLEVSQQVGYESSNSLYFVPNYQGTARLAITLTQPLLNGAGAAYNGSVIVLANINADIARDHFSRDLQALLLDLHRNYWDLYLQRSALVQRTRLYRQAVVIRDELKARQVLDATRGQLIRAESAVASREAALIRYRGAVRNAEARIRALVNDPALAPGGCAEMIPDQMPIRTLVPADLSNSLVTALKARPEIQQGIKEVRAASVRTDVAANEVLPVLNAIIETYVSGLEGHGAIAQAYGDQFSEGRPSYTGGLHFEMPLGGNRSANARLCQRQAELRQTTCQLEATTANVRAEVEIAVRDVDTAYREMASKYHAMAAGEAEIAYLTARWRALPGDQQTAGFALDELLAAQERLAQAEFDFATAEAGYNVALISLCRATGTMVDAQNLDDILKQPCFAQLKKGARQRPAVAAILPVNHPPEANAATPSHQPQAPAAMAQPSPFMVQIPATQPQPTLQPAPWQGQPSQPSESVSATIGMRVDQTEVR
ncbi:MAG: TolC family protein [Thermoguttaceae bacterium]